MLLCFGSVLEAHHALLCVLSLGVLPPPPPRFSLFSRESTKRSRSSVGPCDTRSLEPGSPVVASAFRGLSKALDLSGLRKADSRHQSLRHRTSDVETPEAVANGTSKLWEHGQRSSIFLPGDFGVDSMMPSHGWFLDVLEAEGAHFGVGLKGHLKKSHTIKCIYPVSEGRSQKTTHTHIK